MMPSAFWLERAASLGAAGFEELAEDAYVQAAVATMFETALPHLVAQSEESTYVANAAAETR